MNGPGRAAIRRWGAPLLLLLMAALGGCRSVHDAFTVEARAPGAERARRYRIEVDGWGLCTPGLYATGWYEAALVDPWLGGPPGALESERGELRLVEADLEAVGWRVDTGAEQPAGDLGGERLLVLLGPRTGRLVELLAARSALAAASRLERGRARAALAERADRAARELERARDPSQARRAVLVALRELVGASGHARGAARIDSLAHARSWLRANPDAFRAERAR